jgi:hypothetical protein
VKSVWKRMRLRRPHDGPRASWFNEQNLTEGDALPRACALICEMLVGWTGGDMDAMADVIAMLLNASAQATTARDFMARLAPTPLSASAPA